MTEHHNHSPTCDEIISVSALSAERAHLTDSVRSKHLQWRRHSNKGFLTVLLCDACRESPEGEVIQSCKYNYARIEYKQSNEQYGANVVISHGDFGHFGQDRGLPWGHSRRETRILGLTPLGPHLPASEAGGVEFNRKFCRMVHWTGDGYAYLHEYTCCFSSGSATPISTSLSMTSSDYRSYGTGIHTELGRYSTHLRGREDATRSHP